MPVNTNGLQELLSVIAQQRAAQMRGAEREQAQKNFNAKFEEDKKRYQDQIKQEDARFKAQTGHQQAMLKLAQSQFALSKQEALDKIQQRANETGQLPAGAVDLRNVQESLPPGLGGVIIPELGQINPQDPKEYARTQGEIKFERDKPELDFVQKFKLAQDAARDAADLEQRKVQAGVQSEATKMRQREGEANRDLRREIAQMSAAARNANAGEASDRKAQLDELRRQSASKLTTAQTNALVGGRDMDALVDDVADLLHVPITKGSFKGKKVLDSEFSEGLKEKVLNFGKRVYDEKVANISSPEISDFRAKLEDIQEKSRKDIYGAAFTSTEEKRAFLNRLDQLKHARNKEEAKSIIADIQERIKRNRESAYKALTPIQQEYLDEALKPIKKFVTDAKTGKRVLR